MSEGGGEKFAEVVEKMVMIMPNIIIIIIIIFLRWHSVGRAGEFPFVF